ncbi:alpha/beta fold hydrolase [Gordonia terrae]|uniref:Alpha/beta hydrolase n=2 Tax=Gordonia terrae TaxID=2055 RepID=A0AAD0NW68_9ACTN|nr:alpha/beta fold hydrolase [Gordonia terrae]AWO82897.1 alpha/beta hydrolase [Gordonia terrae]GAB46392.1 putative hydrolase [Gordonia terrae NBRC 100016]VTR09534.1 alpha/beta hydrolase [Clostridioides difficile]VTS28673.1 Lipase 1 precursor [Gordonia terrae]
MTAFPAFVDVEGRQTRVRVEGDPAAPPVLLIHGIGRSLEDWAPLTKRLTQNHRVIAIDLPGSGFTQRSALPTSLPMLASASLATLDTLGERRPLHVVGNSLGGAVAQQLSILAPDRVASLVLISSAGFGESVALPIRFLSTRVLGRFLATHTTQSSARLTERMLFANPDLVTGSRIEHAKAIAQQPGTAEVVWETARELATLRGVRSEWREKLSTGVANARKPTTVIWGDRDRILPARHLAEARRLLPHASTHLLPGVGHMPQIEAPDEVARLFAAFVVSIRANRPPGHVTTNGTAARIGDSLSVTPRQQRC